MKKSILVLFSTLLILLVACNNDPRAKLSQTGSYGIPVHSDKFLGTEEALAYADSLNGKEVYVSGTVDSYCKGEGCWLTLKNNSGEDLFIEVKDKAFVLPYKIENKNAKVVGIVNRDEQDSGKVSILATGITLE